jgi:hypothetical protein
MFARRIVGRSQQLVAFRAAEFDRHEFSPDNEKDRLVHPAIKSGRELLVLFALGNTDSLPVEAEG